MAPSLRRPVHVALHLVAAALLSLGTACFQSTVETTTGSGGSGGAAATTSGGPTTSGSVGTGGTDPNPLTLATWNVLNLIDEVKNSGVPFEDVDPAYAAHRKEVATVIDGLDPLVFMLQEVESQPVLDALNGDLAKPYEHTKLIDGNDPRGIDVAIVSRIPLDKVVSHKKDKFLKAGTSSPVYGYSRDCLEVHLTRNGRHVVLLGVHFKSKDSDDPDKRLAEAQHTRVIANGLAKEDPSALIAILGDFNDYPGTATLDAIEQGMPPFVDAALAVPENDRWTYKYGGKIYLIDHLYASPELHAGLDPASAKILHTKAVTAASDHAPVFAAFDVK